MAAQHVALTIGSDPAAHHTTAGVVYTVCSSTHIDGIMQGCTTVSTGSRQQLLLYQLLLYSTTLAAHNQV
jgi:hypothetical protein